MKDYEISLSKHYHFLLAKTEKNEAVNRARTVAAHYVCQAIPGIRVAIKHIIIFNEGRTR